MRRPWAALIVAGAAFALLWLLHAVGSLERLELVTLDARYASGLGRKAPGDDIVIAWIDQESMEFMDENGFSFPWPRSVHAAVMDYVLGGGARAVVFDVLFDQRAIAEDDAEFGASLAATDAAVLAMKLVDSRAGGRNEAETERLVERAMPMPAGVTRAAPAKGAVLPIDDLEPHAARLGFVNVRPDSDKVYRRYDLLRAWAHPGQASPVAQPSLALSAALASGADERAMLERASRSDDARILLNFRGPEFTFEHVKFVNLFVSMNNVAEGAEPLYPAERFADKIVLVGIHAEGYEDVHPTPLSRVFPGVELHATALDNLLRGDALRSFGHPLAFGAAAAAAAVGCVLFLPGVLAPTAALAALLAAFLGAVTAAWASLVVWPVAAPVLGLLLGGSGSFVWRLVVEGRQRRQMRRAFSSYLAPEVLSEVLKDPDAVALGGEARDVTVFFTDLEGFTTLAERTAPVELVAFLNDYFTRMCEPILEQHGVIDKFVGDAIMALFGAPLRAEDHAARAVRAALAAGEISARIAAELRAAGKPAIATRIGVHTGRAIVGNMGSSKRFDYTAIGDTVNLAARLEGANKYFGTRCLVSESTWRQAAAAAGPTLVGREVGLVAVKGREEAIAVFEPLGSEDRLDAAVRRRAELHARGVAAVRAGDHSGARAAFEELAGDGAFGELARVYLDRLADPSWRGVFRLDAK